MLIVQEMFVFASQTTGQIKMKNVELCLHDIFSTSITMRKHSHFIMVILS
jgi:hypothetical protein